MTRFPGVATFIGCVVCIAAAGRAAESQDPPFVPLPQSVRLDGGRLALTGGSRIAAAAPELVPLAKVLSDEIALAAGVRLEAVEGQERGGDVVLRLGDMPKEAYSLTVADKAVVIGGGYRGAAMGTATLLQAIALEGGKAFLPRGTIEDRPACAYRGLLVDVARQWHDVETLRQCIELCRLYKINYLQLHLTDSESWVFPSRAYPQLITKNWNGGRAYTVEDLKGLVAFADARGVTIVPEIETPGHSGAAARTMPEVFDAAGPDGKPVGVGCMNMANDGLYEALDVLVGELAEVFHSSPYIHIGCDEVWLGEIRKAPQLKEALRKRGFDDPHDLFMDHIVRMNELVKKRGRQTIVWEGFPNDGSGKVRVPKDILVMAFEITYNPAPNLVKHGYTIINTAWTPLYVLLGIRQTPEHIRDWNLHRFGRFGTDYARTAWTDIAPTPQVAGAQMCSWEQPAWAEFPSLRDRLPAMSERIWNPQAGGTFAQYARRAADADRLVARLIQPVTIKAEGLLAPGPQRGRDEPTQGLGYDEYLFAKPLKVTLALAAPAAQGEVIRYTLDGGEPAAASPAYAAPLEITEKDCRGVTPNANYPHVMQVTVKARAFRGGVPAGYTTTQFYRYHYIGAMPRKVRFRLYEVPAGVDRMPDDPAGLKLVAGSEEPWMNMRAMPHVMRPGRFGIVYEGRVELKAAGEYEFVLRSQGGKSRLFVDGKLVVDRRADDWGETKGKAALDSGAHAVALEYVGGGDFMTATFGLAAEKPRKSLDSALAVLAPAPR